MKIRVILATTAACGVAILFAQLLLSQQGPAGPNTQGQAAAGRAVYRTNRASCHSAGLSGRESPQLAGANFLSQRGGKTTGELIALVKNYVPVTDAMLQDGSPLGNDPPPIVHNGVLYVNNAAQVLQALRQDRRAHLGKSLRNHAGPPAIGMEGDQVRGQPGGDTWGGLPDSSRRTAQAKPWMRASRGSGNGATLSARQSADRAAKPKLPRIHRAGGR